ncbi:MAG: histidinol-phosphate transaminase [Anaeromicrobium sp.]|jgi:histidinol-phosphate aminotransferase|uniref:histidinol-phosphate transaminase n=1 Tax=Anaeromicrobium sp. TaxID=1929132 RepID=UPI0025DE12C5|nr:histidinol-phosphate transaminase [Anaeromicrobium sp.]MCT4593895.1 histidinol-phosphate transaminase [Anaeromicrobium sp.]
MSTFKREDLKNLQPYEVEKEKYEIKLDANESFIEYEEKIKDEMAKVIKKVSLNRYPDGSCEELCRLYGKYIGVDESNIVAGNGSDELIGVIMNAFLNRGDTLGTVFPDFSMYKVYSQLLSINFKEIYDYTMDEIYVDLIIENINESKCDLFILSNPNNPTGKIIGRSDIIKLLKGVNCLVVIDEAYMEFASESVVDLVNEFENLIVLRTCSKALGLAFLRLGFCICNKALKNEILKAKSPFNVSGLSGELGKVVFQNREVIYENIDRLLKERDRVYEKLKGNKNLQCVKPNGNFIFIKSDYADRIYEKLLDRGIRVRNFSGKLKDYFRITIGSEKDNERLLHELLKI